MPLTALKIRSAEARARPYKVTDGQGLFLHVAPSGTKTFRMAFRLGGKEQLLTFGRVPEISLADARYRRDEARRQLRLGVDPRTGRQAGATAANDDAPTFTAMATAWLDDQVAHWSPAHAVDVRRGLELHVLPAIGAMPLAAIDAPAVLRVLKAVADGGAVETARRIRTSISAVFARAIAEGVADVDPAARVTKALRRPAEPRHHPAALAITRVRAVLAAVDQVDGADVAKLASRFLALTVVRWAAVRGARWEEIEHLDGPEPSWRVPAARMKLTVSRKADAGNDHVVPLSPAAVAVLRAARDACPAAAGLIFVGRGGAMLGENALVDLYARAGLRGRHTPHGWRASFSTIMNDQHPGDRAAIDLALAHAPTNKVEAAYNRSEQLGQRRQLLTIWGGWLFAGDAVAVPAPPGAAE